MNRRFVARLGTGNVDVEAEEFDGVIRRLLLAPSAARHGNRPGVTLRAT